MRRLTWAAQVWVLAALPSTGRARGWRLALGVLIEEERDGVEAGAVGGADLGDGRAEFAGQLEGIDVAAAGLHEVAHIEQDEGGQADGEDRRGEHELAGEVEGIEDQDDGVGLGRAGHFAAEHVDGDAGVFRVGGERVDAGQVDEGEVFAADAGHEAHALLDGDAGEVGDLLAQAGEAVEEGGLAGVGRADEDNGPEGSGRWAERRAEQRPEGCSRRSSGGLERVRGRRGLFGSGSFGAASAGRTRMASAVSWRRAISMPSTA